MTLEDLVTAVGRGGLELPWRKIGRGQDDKHVGDYGPAISARCAGVAPPANAAGLALVTPKHADTVGLGERRCPPHLCWVRMAKVWKGQEKKLRRSALYKNAKLVAESHFRKLGDIPPNAPIKSAVQMREYEAIVQRIVQDGPRQVLDWGCGYGHIAYMLKTVGVDVAAMDYFETLNLPVEPSHLGDEVYEYPWYPGLRIHLTRDAVTLPFTDKSFDAVVSCGVLEHVHDPDGSLEEIRRILRPGGRFYVYKLPNRYSYIELIARIAARWKQTVYFHGAHPDDRLYSKRTAAALLESHGFAVAKLRRANMLPLRSGRFFPWASGVIWGTNRVLARVPVLNIVATNLECVGLR